MHLNEHIMDKLGETVERQTESSDKGREGRMAVRMTVNDRGAYAGPSPRPGLCPELCDDLGGVLPHSAENCIRN